MYIISRTGSITTLFTTFITTFSNIPANPAIIEIDGVLNSGTVGVRLHSIQLGVN